MPRRMVAAEDQLVSFTADFRVLVSTESESAELWIRQFAIDDAASPGDFALFREVDAHLTDDEVAVPTPDLGSVTQVRLFALRTGSPTGDGLLIDELIVPRLDPSGRRSFLTDCTESDPQVETATGGTFVRALAASGSTVTLGQVFLGRELPSWQAGEAFPVFRSGTFLVSALSAGPDVIHDVLVVDERSPGWTTSPRLSYGMRLGFVCLVWDSDGGWDFTWTRQAAMPGQPGPGLPAAERLRTRDRRVDFHVSALVCLDDSDDLSHGEATFTLTMQPSDGSAAQTRAVRWNPMASSSGKTLDERFQVSGVAAGAPTLSVSAVEDDSGSFPSDSDDTASSNAFLPAFRQGPGLEAFTEDATLAAGPGGDGFRFQVHCSADVSYV